MGFDLIGIKAKSKQGEYFRNNVWHWRPLKNYVLTNCKIPKASHSSWDYNDGAKVSERTAIKIASTLKALIESGHTARYAEEYEAKRKVMTGGTWEKNYPFTVENVIEFADFCEESGGFKIC